jgi:hypothetical protein
MSKRVALADHEVTLLVAALKRIRNEPGIDYTVTHEGQRSVDRLIAKLQPASGEPGYAESKRQEKT